MFRALRSLVVSVIRVAVLTGVGFETPLTKCSRKGIDALRVGEIEEIFRDVVKLRHGGADTRLRFHYPELDEAQE